MTLRLSEEEFAELMRRRAADANYGVPTAEGREAKPKRAKYGNRKVVVDGMKFDSQKEADYYLGVLLPLWKAGELKLLRAEEPRVLSPVEVMLAESVWLEDIDKEKVVHGLRCSSGGGKHWFVISSMEAVSALDSDYGVRWRAWTSEPTTGQRKEAKWG